MKKLFFFFLFISSIKSTSAQTCVTTYGTVNVTTTCPEMPYYYNGFSYYYGGSFTVNLTNAAGCDSIVTLNISTPSPNEITYRTVYSCELPVYSGCDDVYAAGTYTCTWPWGSPECGYRYTTLVLTVINVDTIRTKQTICYPAEWPYQWQGQTIYEEGIYYHNYTNNGICAVEELELHFAYNAQSNTSVSICADKLPYQWNGQTISAEGNYTAVIPTGAACDSIAYLNLAVNPNKKSTTNVTVCANALPYTWNGSNYTAAGSYTKAIPHAGCDSLATLNLTVKPLSTISSFTPTSGSQGQAIVITGTNFNEVSTVSFGGTPAASFIVVSPTSIVATVGSGTSGPVAVTTSCNTSTLAGFTHTVSAGNIGIGINAAPSKLTIGGGDVYIYDIGSGIILKSPNGNCWRVTIDNNGNLVRTLINCP